MCVCVFVYVLYHRIEKDKTPTSPYLLVCSDGVTYFANHGVLVCTCRMHVYQFPFDVQSCRLSFKSIVHSRESATVLYAHMHVCDFNFFLQCVVK